MSNPWTPFYWRDYIGDTGHLSLMEHGAYLLLMAHYYMTGEPLPANAEQLHRICRAFADAERHACQAVLDQFFVLDGGVYRNPRADEEIEKARKISEVRSKAAQSKHAKAHANAPAIAEQMHTQPQPQPQSHTEPDSKAIAPSAPAKRSTQLPASFDLTDEMRHFARENGVADPAREFAAFCDYHRSKGSTFKDWIAAWRTWVRNANKFAGKGKAPPAGYLNETRDDLLAVLTQQSGEVQ